MAKQMAKWLVLDVNSLEDSGNGALRVKVVPAGAIERTVDGINIKNGGVAIVEWFDSE